MYGENLTKKVSITIRITKNN